MTTFIMLTRLNTDAVRSPRSLEQLERDVMKRIREECPAVESAATPCSDRAIISMSLSPTTLKRRPRSRP
jgi:hypothetical protein